MPHGPPSQPGDEICTASRALPFEPPAVKARPACRRDAPVKEIKIRLFADPDPYRLHPIRIEPAIRWLACSAGRRTMGRSPWEPLSANACCVCFRRALR